MRGTLGRRRRRHFLQGVFLWTGTKAPMMDSTQPLNHTFHEMNITVEMFGYQIQIYWDIFRSVHINLELAKVCNHGQRWFIKWHSKYLQVFNQRESYKWFERAHSLTCQLNLRSIRYKIKNFNNSPESCWTIKGRKTQPLHFSNFSVAFHALNPKFKVKASLSRARLASVIFPRHEIEKGRELSWVPHEIFCPPCISSSALLGRCSRKPLKAFKRINPLLLFHL